MSRMMQPAVPDGTTIQLADGRLGVIPAGFSEAVAALIADGTFVINNSGVLQVKNAQSAYYSNFQGLMGSAYGAQHMTETGTASGIPIALTGEWLYRHRGTMFAEGTFDGATGAILRDWRIYAFSRLGVGHYWVESDHVAESANFGVGISIGQNAPGCLNAPVWVPSTKVNSPRAGFEIYNFVICGSGAGVADVTQLGIQFFGGAQ